PRIPLFSAHCILSFLLSRTRTQPTTLFPYTTLFRSEAAKARLQALGVADRGELGWRLMEAGSSTADPARLLAALELLALAGSLQDRKSTRLNSSHVSISYAVFCLKIITYCFAYDNNT